MIYCSYVCCSSFCRCPVPSVLAGAILPSSRGIGPRRVPMSTARINIPRSARSRNEDEFYPYCDGEPMAESDLHAEEMTYAYYTLQRWLEDRPDAYVSLDTFLYYREGDPS